MAEWDPIAPRTRRQNYSDAVAIQAEGSRIGVVTCLACGAALLLSVETESMGLHDEWHATLEARTTRVPAHSHDLRGA